MPKPKTAKKALVGILGFCLAFELLLAAGGFISPPRMLAEFRLAVSPDSLFMTHILAWMLLLVSMICAVALRDVLRDRLAGWTLSQVLGLWWIGIGLSLAFGFGRMEHLAMDALKGALLFAAAWASKPSRAYLVAVAFLGIPLPAFSADALSQQTRVSAVTGKVLFEDREIHKGDKLSAPGTVSTAPGARASLELAGGHVLTLQPDTRLRLNQPSAQGPEEHELLKGTARFMVKEALPGTPPTRFRIRTRTAVMGVRGTDFMNVANPLLAETEIVVFDGQVSFDSVADAGDRRIINKGQWGGIGGRFGNRTTRPIQLPTEALNEFDRATSPKGDRS